MLAFLSKSKRDQAKVKRAARPQALAQALGRELIINHAVEPDLAWSLMQVASPSSMGENRFDIRIYSARRASGSGVAVDNYQSLDGHPQLVLYHGWLNIKNNDAKLYLGPEKDPGAS